MSRYTVVNAATPERLAKPQLVQKYFARPEEGRRLRIEAEHAKTAMLEISLLESDWDGFGAMAVSKVTRINAWAALTPLLGANLVPEVSPNPTGTISFEWESGDAKAHAQIGTTRYSMYITAEDGETRYFAGPAGELSRDATEALARALASAEAVAMPVTSGRLERKRGFASA